MTGSSYESYLSAPGPTVLLSPLSLEGFSQTTLLLKKRALGTPALFLRLCNLIHKSRKLNFLLSVYMIVKMTGFL